MKSSVIQKRAFRIFSFFSFSLYRIKNSFSRIKAERNLRVPNKWKWIEMNWNGFLETLIHKCWNKCFSILNAFLFIYRNCMDHISVPFNLKIILAFFVHNTHIVNIVQFKILNRKCSISIQLHPNSSNWIQLNKKKVFTIYVFR